MAIIQNLEAFVQSYPAGLDSVTDLQLSQNENGRQIRFTIGGVTIPAGSVATISGTKPDGVVYSNTGTIEGADTVIFDEDVQMTAVFGTWYAKIRITNAGNTIASARVRFIIDKDPVDAGAIPSESQLDGLVAEAEEYAEAAEDAAGRAAITYGSPLTASTAAAMTDVNRVYVYTGSESGYTYGNWYYYNGSAWVSGGIYNSAAVETDTTLTESGVPADAKATGDKIAELKDDLDQFIEDFGGSVDDAVNYWLDEHPEATTTVQDGSLTKAKFSDTLKLETIKDYVTPQMYGAKGDGSHDDTSALSSAFNSGKNVFIPKGKYLVSAPIDINNDRIIIFGEKALTKTGASATDNCVIFADDGFSGDYVLKFNGHSYGGQILNCGVQLYNFVIDSNGNTGGIYIPVLYDNCFIKSVSILNVGNDYVGIHSPALQYSLTQTVNIESVWITGELLDSSAETATPLMLIERWQECIFNNLKIIGTNKNCLEMYGCLHLTFIECSMCQRNYNNGIATGGTGTGYKIRPFIKTGVAVSPSLQMSFINCLNEGCAKAIDIYNLSQTLLGTFNSDTYDTGKEVTQGANKGYILSKTASYIYMMLDEESELFSSGSCSEGTVTSAPLLYQTGGIKVNNLRTMGISNTEIDIIGISNSIFNIGKSNENSIHKLIAINNNCVVFEYPYSPSAVNQFDFENSTLDGTIEIKSAEPVTITAISGQTVTLPKAHRGLRVIVQTSGVSNIAPYYGDNVDGFGSLAYYSKYIEFLATSDNTWTLVQGISAFPVSVVSGGTIGNNASCRSPENASLSFRLTADSTTFSLSVELASRDIVFFNAYNETQNRSLVCYIHDTAKTIVPYTSGAITSGDIICINVTYALKH